MSKSWARQSMEEAYYFSLISGANIQGIISAFFSKYLGKPGKETEIENGGRGPKQKYKQIYSVFYEHKNNIIMGYFHNHSLIVQ